MYETCGLCGDPITDPRAWIEVAGWSNPGPSGRKHGGSQIVNRRRTGRLAHPECAKEGTEGGQKPLFR